MRLAISNIAWPADQESVIADRLPGLGVDGVEIAPTKVWPHPLETSPTEILAYRRFWEQRGLPIVALQALLFEKPHLRLFEDRAQRTEMAAYLSGMIRLAQRLGATVLVFGSPKNRTRNALPLTEADEIAATFFRYLGQIALDHQLFFCIEPNPIAYGCDYVTCAAEGIQLVRRVNHPGFGLHLDAAAMTLSGDEPADVFAKGYSNWRHFHVSEPYLTPIGEGTVDHQAMARGLVRVGYSGCMSIEMKVSSNGFSVADLEMSISRVQSTYRQPV